MWYHFILLYSSFGLYTCAVHLFDHDNAVPLLLTNIKCVSVTRLDGVVDSAIGRGEMLLTNALRW